MTSIVHRRPAHRLAHVARPAGEREEQQDGNDVAAGGAILAADLDGARGLCAPAHADALHHQSAHHHGVESEQEELTGQQARQRCLPMLEARIGVQREIRQ